MCAEWQNTLSPQPRFSAGGHGARLQTVPNKAVRSGGIRSLINSAHLQHLSDSECLFGPLVAALFVLLVLSGNVFAARRKPSDCKPNLHPLETHQLYSRLISCTRTISILPWELKCVCGVDTGTHTNSRNTGHISTFDLDKNKWCVWLKTNKHMG